jgi:hypothetical protein
MRLLRGRLSRPQQLAHRAHDDATLTDDRRVARIERVEADAFALRQGENLCADLANQRQEAVVLVDRASEVERAGEPKIPPLGVNDLGPAKTRLWGA